MLTDLRRLLSATLDVIVLETDRIADVDCTLLPCEGRVGGRSLDGEGDAPLRASETVDNDFSFLGGTKGRLPADGLLAWLDDRGRADGEAMVTTICCSRGFLLSNVGTNTKTRPH